MNTIEQLRTERDALAAEVERLRDALQSFTRMEPCDCGCPEREKPIAVNPTHAYAIAKDALSTPSNATAILDRRDAETLRKAAALIDNIEVEQTNHCMNVYEEGERYKQDAIEAIKRMADELEANAKEEK